MGKWEKQAKSWENTAYLWLNTFRTAYFKAEEERDEAQQVARRLLRERDDAKAVVETQNATILHLNNEIQTLASHIGRLETERDEARENYSLATDELDRQVSQVNHLESDRDALARQCDELRAQNIELKKLLVSVDKERLELYRALEQVEWDEDDYCQWCDHWKKDGHWDQCPRQKALRKA